MEFPSSKVSLKHTPLAAKVSIKKSSAETGKKLQKDALSKDRVIVSGGGSDKSTSGVKSMQVSTYYNPPSRSSSGTYDNEAGTPKSKAEQVGDLLSGNSQRKDSVRRYTSSHPTGYKGINGSLRDEAEGRKSAFGSIPSIDGDVKNIDGFLADAKASGLTYSEPSLRGVKDYPGNPLKSIQRNQLYSDAGYLSTAKGSLADPRNMTVWFTENKGSILHVNGQSGVDITSVRSDEKEVLYPRNTQFRTMLNVPKDGTEKNTVLLQEIPEELSGNLNQAQKIFKKEDRDTIDRLGLMTKSENTASNNARDNPYI